MSAVSSGTFGSFAIEQRIDELLPVLNVSCSRSDIVSQPYELVPTFCALLASDSSQQAAAELLTLLPEVCRPKELLIALLEQADAFKEDFVFSALLRPIGSCLMKLESKRHLSLGCALETLVAHIVALKPPDEPTECVDSLPTGFDGASTETATLISQMMDFIEPFADEVSWQQCRRTTTKKPDSHSFKIQVRNITCQILKILGCSSLAATNLCHRLSDGEQVLKNDCRLVSERCVNLLLKLHPDVVKLTSDIREGNEAIERQHVDCSKRRQQAGGETSAGDDTEEVYNVEETVSELGLGVLAYLVFGEHVAPDCVPLTYDMTFLLKFNFRFATLLLREQRSGIVQKGIILCSSLVSNIETKVLEAELFEWPEAQDLLEAVVTVMTSSRVKEICRMAIQFLTAFIKSFTLEGRSRILEFLLLSSKNGSIQGHAITLIKNEINESLSSTDNGNSVFEGFNLRHTLHLIFQAPPGGFRSSLLTQQSDRVMAALNLLRYIAIRDKPSENRTGIKDLLDDIDAHYLKPLHTTIQLERAAVLAEMKNLDPNGSGGSTTNSVDCEHNCSMELTVGDKSLEELTSDQKREAMYSALMSLDMMESVLGRVEDLVSTWRS